jgi:hypothetical protein
MKSLSMFEGVELLVNVSRGRISCLLDNMMTADCWNGVSLWLRSYVSMEDRVCKKNECGRWQESLKYYLEIEVKR